MAGDDDLLEIGAGARGRELTFRRVPTVHTRSWGCAETEERHESARSNLPRDPEAGRRYRDVLVRMRLRRRWK
jgi:hypothetical protein